METLHVVTDADIRRMLTERYGGHGGGSRLAETLRVSPATASVLRNGGGPLDKVAMALGYVSVEETPGLWRPSAKPGKPELAGYKRWTVALLIDVRRRLIDGEAVPDIARALGVSARRMREVIKQHHLRNAEGRLSYDDLIANAQAEGDEDLERRVRIEKNAREGGGSPGEQFAAMSRDLMTDDEAREFDAQLKALIDARK